jgi:zinc transport system substrate-binding protein
MLKRVLGFILIVFFWAIPFVRAEIDPAGNRLEIVATLFPVFDFVKAVGQEKVNVSLLLPAGVEPHAFEPKPTDVIRVNKADIFIYTGKYMEPWVEDILKGAFNKNLAVVDMSRDIELLDEEDDDSHHDHGAKDPHIWLDLGNAQVMVNAIANVLIEKDPRNKDFYSSNAKEYNAKLAGLDLRFRDTFSRCKYKTIIYGGHFAFGYFAKRYHLEHVSPYPGFSPNAEPTPRAIGELINKLKKSGIKYIYYEELLDPKVARTIAKETGANLEMLHGAHNLSKDELIKGLTFLDIMEDNLRKLKTGLVCE